MQKPIPQPARRNVRRLGMTLVETIVALALLVVCGVTGVYAFMVLNRYAARERNQSSAKALCQERIEQVLSTGFEPPGVLPRVIGQDNVAYDLLGTSGNYTAAGVYIGAETTSEAVTVYVAQDNSSATAVPGIRTTAVTPSTIIDSGGTGLLGLVQFAVKVSYTVNGEARSYSMYTMRAPDY